jgi:hypothetical protein
MFYLSVWFKATVLRDEDLVHPPSHTDILIIDEPLTNDTETMRSLVQKYGSDLALLSINTSKKQRGKLTSFEKRFPLLEKIQRPLSPGKLSKALLRCVQKLDTGSSTAAGSPSMESSELSPVEQTSQQHEEPAISPSSARPTEDSLPQSICSNLEEAVLSAPSAAESPEMAPFPRSRKVSSPSSSVKPLHTRQKPRVLLVEDNAINLKLLQTFVRKHGVHEIQTAENGRAAINAVEQHAKGFDIIFMGRLILSLSPAEASSLTTHVQIVLKRIRRCNFKLD